MEERRKINRLEYNADSVIVVCDTLEKIYGKAVNISPLGLAVNIPGGSASVNDKDVIVVAETLIMYADVVREDVNEDGSKTIALSARKFTPEVMQYLFKHISIDEDSDEL
jgi:hypothetical protein